MNIINKLTLRHLRMNRNRTLITIIGITLSVAMVCAVAGFTLSLREVLRRAVIEGRGDYHIGYSDVDPQTAASIAEEKIFSDHYLVEDDDGDVSIYLHLAKPSRKYDIDARNISNKYNLQGYTANKELLALDGAIAGDQSFRVVLIIAVFAVTIIAIGSIIVIANTFYISASERVRQFGLLKSIGATKTQISRSILFEAFFLSVIALPIGIAFGFLIQEVVLYIVNNLLGEINSINKYKVTFQVVFNPLIIYITVAVAIITIVVSAWIPASKAAKTSPIDAIRQTKDIRIRSGKLKTSRLTSKIFGFEGTLAAKSMKRSRGKYRATVISLTVSIVLFISMYSFIWIMNKDVQMQYGEYNLDVLASMKGDINELNKADSVIEAIPGAEIIKSRLIQAVTKVPEDFYSDREKERYKDVKSEDRPLETPLTLICIPDADFQAITPVSNDEIQGILVNTTGYLRSGSKILEYIPYNFINGIQLPVMLSGNESSGSKNLNLIAQTDKVPETTPFRLFDGERVNIIISESTFNTFAELSDSKNVFAIYSILTTEPDKFCEEARAAFQGNDSFTISNFAQLTRMNRDIELIVMLFGYGFIAMLSLIAVTSVITTISTSMALRKQEFATLYSVGMTPESMNRMLNLESIMYGLKSLAIGLPIGIILSYLIYYTTDALIEFNYQPPWISIVICIIAVMLITFGTMRYAKRKLNAVSIIETIRGENI